MACDTDGDALQGSEGLDDLSEAVAGRGLQVAGDREGCEHDREVCLDRLAGVVKNWAGPQIGFGDAERLLGVAAR